MKKITLLFAALILVSGIAQAQKMFAVNNRIQTYQNKNANKQATEQPAKKKKSAGKKDYEVSYLAKQNFSNDFGNVTSLVWRGEPIFSVATFTKGGQVMEAYYNDEGKLVGTITPKVYTDIPADGLKEITKHYSGYVPVNVIYYDDNEDNPDDIVFDGTEFTRDSYFVEMAKDNHHIVLQVQPDGAVSFFEDMK